MRYVSWIWLVPITSVTMIIVCMLLTEGGIINYKCVVYEGKTFKVMLINCGEQIDKEVKGNWSINGIEGNKVHLIN